MPTSLIVFGSQGGVPDQAYLSSIRSFLLQDKHTIPLVETIITLPAWWDTICLSHTRLQRIAGRSLFKRLRQWLLEGVPVGFDRLEPNTILAPLTVITQVVEYLWYLRSCGADHGSISQAAGAQGFQGLCIGQLTAIACCSALDERQLIKQAAVAVRLAILIGAIVDLDGCLAEPPREWVCVVARHKSTNPSTTITDVLDNYPEVRCHAPQICSTSLSNMD
jgi:hypothetical protein